MIPFEHSEHFGCVFWVGTAAMFHRPLRRVARENEVAGIDGAVAGVTVLHEISGSRFAVVEMAKPPTASRQILLRILDHELHAVGWRAGDKGLLAPKNFVIFLRRKITPRHARDDRSVRKRNVAFAISFDSDIIAEN